MLERGCGAARGQTNGEKTGGRHELGALMGEDAG